MFSNCLKGPQAAGSLILGNVHFFAFSMASQVVECSSRGLTSSGILHIFSELDSTFSHRCAVEFKPSKTSIPVEHSFPRRSKLGSNQVVKHGHVRNHTLTWLSSTLDSRGFYEEALVTGVIKEKQGQIAIPSGGGRKQFIATGYGWRIRDAARNELGELMSVADIQTGAFRIPAAAFDELFYKLFHAEVLSSLQYKVRHSPPDRYTCLVAERDAAQLGFMERLSEEQSSCRIVGVVDLTALSDSDILGHLPGASEYLYVSGMAVDESYRRQNVATLLLQACLVRALEWGFEYMVLHAYEDDIRARNLYSRAGYKVVSLDPAWMTKLLGRRRRVVMARRSVN